MADVVGGVEDEYAREGSSRAALYEGAYPDELGYAFSWKAGWGWEKRPP